MGHPSFPLAGQMRSKRIEQALAKVGIVDLHTLAEQNLATLCQIRGVDEEVLMGIARLLTARLTSEAFCQSPLAQADARYLLWRRNEYALPAARAIVDLRLKTLGDVVRERKALSKLLATLSQKEGEALREDLRLANLLEIGG